LVIIIAVVASFNGISDVTPTNSISDTLSIQTDLSSYDKKDIISVSGISDTSGSVNLSIENKNNELVWAEQVSLKSNGRYSTLAIAGGPGWESSGTYTINVDNGVEIKSNTFSFTT
jgi:flagellar hook assembly protein FlgD